MRMPRTARISIAVALVLLAVLSLYLFFSSAGSIPIAGLGSHSRANPDTALI